MKIFKSVILFAVSCCFFYSHSFAQKYVSEVTLNYSISIESGNDKPSFNSLDGTVLSLYIKGTESRSDMVSSLGTESNIFDSKTGKGYILKEYSGQKLMITMNKENWMQKNKYFQNMKFSIDNTEELIAGIQCKKATATTDDGKTFVVYFNANVIPVNKEYNNAFKNLPGIPVKYELESGKLKFIYILTSMSYDNIPAGKFEIPKSGFRVMTYDENQQLKKG